MQSDHRANYHFDQLREQFQRELLLLNKYKEINVFLRRNDWLFVCPIFFQGFELDYFSKLNDIEQPKEKILKIIASKFYNLNWTASFVDGYCSRCDYIKPFLSSIETSIILAFQKEYEGSIKTLIPIIEGILRKYLISEKGLSDDIKFEHIRKSINILLDDILDREEKILQNYYDQNNTKILFSIHQINELLKFQKEYYTIWFSFISDFFDNSLYLNTKRKKIKNEINRHSILHELGNDFDYNFENFIKIFFVILFLTWIYLKKEGKSLLNQIDSKIFLDKVISYKNIIEKSEKLDYDKHVLLFGKKGYRNETLKQRFNPIIDMKLKKRHWWFIKINRWLQENKWRTQ
jgi:hypothetical protein